MAAPAAAFSSFGTVLEALQEIRDDALLLAEPSNVQRAHVRREEAPSRRSPLLGSLQLFEENSSFLFDGGEQIRHSMRI